MAAPASVRITYLRSPRGSRPYTQECPPAGRRAWPGSPGTGARSARRRSAGPESSRWLEAPVPPPGGSCSTAPGTRFPLPSPQWQWRCREVGVGHVRHHYPQSVGGLPRQPLGGGVGHVSSWAAGGRTRSLVSALISGRSSRVRDTVAGLTPASAATSLMVVRRIPFSLLFVQTFPIAPLRYHFGRETVKFLRLFYHVFVGF